MKQQRLREFDFLRAFAALSVIAIHITAGFVQSSHLGYLWNQAMRYAVPVFIILSGFLLYYVEIGRPKMSYTGFLQKRFKKILIPYLIWTFLYVVFTNRHEMVDWIAGEWRTPFELTAKHLILGTGYIHLYFLLIVLQLYVLYPLLRNWLEAHASSLLISSFVVTLFAQTMIYLHQLQVFVLPSLGIPYVSLFPLWLFYFVFGMLAAQRKQQWEEKLHGKTLLLAILWAVSFVLLLVDSYVTKTYASSIKPSVMLYCFTSYFFLYAMSMRVRDTKQKMGELLDWLSTHSFLIFLLHPLLLNMLVQASKRFGFLQLWSGNVGMLYLFIATCAATVLLTHIISLTPFAAWFGGLMIAKQKNAQVSAPS